MRKSTAFLLLILGSIHAQERSISGGGSRNRDRFSAGKSQVVGFNCPEDFGYYPHPTDCGQYYVCVFGGALLESCTGGLMYSNELQTCDWPRNVQCNLSKGPGISTVQITDPRTSSRGGSQVLSATESFASASLKRGVDNTIRTKEPLKSSGSSKSVFDDSARLRSGRFILGQESTNQNFNTGFQAQETSSRSFNVVAASPNVVAASPSPKFVFPPPLPGASTNRFAAPTVAPAVASAPASGQSFYSDLLNLNDTDYYYYYDDILYDDYYEPSVKTTPKPRSSSRSRGSSSDPAAPNSVSSSVNVVTASVVNNRGRGSTNRSPSSLTSSPDTSFNSPPSPSSPFLGTFASSATRSSSTRSGGDSSTSFAKQTKKPTSKTSSPTRGSSSSLSSTKTTSQSGIPELAGKNPQRLIRPSKKPPPVSNRGALITDIWNFPPRRPAPQYPQPQVDSLAQPCDPAVCRLPDCYCGQTPVPGNIPAQNVPQMVLLTFDDSVNDLNKKLYVDLFEKGRVNPNGCPIASTMYVSHEWTDYSQVQNLYSDGHEIASHSITHSFGEKFSTEKWAKEVGGQREIMSAYGGVRMEDIRGMRAPFLAIGGNNMFRMLYDLNFTYDSSMPVYENRPPSWPYTIDYKIFHDCMIPPCPTHSYPGVWEVPMVMWQDLTGGRCSMGDACTTPADAEGVYKFLIKNFERHYTTNRSPLGLYYHAAWFTTPHHKEGFIAFLDTITAMDDVWLVTNWQALQWVRNPVPLSQAKSFKPFQCDYPERPPRCTTPKVCNVRHKGSVRYLKTCQQCPEYYPWVGNTGVQSPLNDI